MNILFYTPLNTRCRDIESLALEFKKKGHSIFLLTQSPHSGLHDNFASYGYKVASDSFTSRFIYLNLLVRFLKFTSYCWRNNIDVVYSHLEPCNFIAALAQYLVKARVIICRHHMDYARLYGFDGTFSYRITYSLAKDIVVVSQRTKEYMEREEHISGNKIHHINLGYDFQLYGSPDMRKAADIRKLYSADVLLLTVCRLTKFKKPEVSIALVKELRNAGVNARLLILGNGDLYDQLQETARSLNLIDHVFLTGYVSNVLDYMAASDFLVHPSVTESSCITIKEAGLALLPVIVCKGVGDFDEVIQHGKNGFLVESKDFIRSSFGIIQELMPLRSRREEIARNLQATVYEKFNVTKTAPYYESLFHHPVR